MGFVNISDSIIETLNQVTWVSRDCPVCGTIEKELLFQDRNRREGYAIETGLVRCTRCGMRYLDPAPSSFDWLSEYSKVHSIAVSRQRPRTGLTIRAAEYVIARWVRLWSSRTNWHTAPHEPGHGRRLLDIGCGNGKKLIAYQDRGFEVYGIDVAAEAIAQARQHVPEGCFQVGTFEEADYPHDYFDVIRFDNVLEHVYDPKTFLQKAHLLLRPGGTAFGFVPSGSGPTVTLMGKYSINSWVPFHLNLFTPGCLRDLAEDAGFSVRVLSAPHPEWMILSLKQWASRRQPSFDEKSRNWWDRFLFLAITPLWWVLNKVWQGEELILVAAKQPPIPS